MASSNWRMPAEDAPHLRTWMAFGASERIWGRDLLPEVRRNLAILANTIARYEPVTMLVREAEYDLAAELMDPAVELVVCPLDDLWIRDTGPVFVLDQRGQKAAVNLNFNGWGEKQAHTQDAQVAAFVAEQAGVELLGADIVMEGGGIEVDGLGTALATESCILNDNRNPGWTKADCEAELKALLGLEKIIWLPGVRGQDITDGHIDFYARFAKKNVLAVGYEPDPSFADHAITQENIDLLRGETDLRNVSLQLNILSAWCGEP